MVVIDVSKGIATAAEQDEVRRLRRALGDELYFRVFDSVFDETVVFDMPEKHPGRWQTFLQVLRNAVTQ